MLAGVVGGGVGRLATAHCQVSENGVNTVQLYQPIWEVGGICLSVQENPSMLCPVSQRMLPCIP